MDVWKANFEITRMARLLGMTQQRYYAWQQSRQQEPGPRAQRREVIDQAVREQSRTSTDDHGAPRIARELAAKVMMVDRKTVATSMRRQGLEHQPMHAHPGEDAPKPCRPGFAVHAQRR